MSDPHIHLEVEEHSARYMAWGYTQPFGTLLRFGVILMGWAATELTGTGTAAVNIYDGSDTTGSILLPIRLAAGESAESWYGPGGIRFQNGLTVQVSTGQALGSVFFRHHRPG